MNIRKFTGATSRDALRLVREALGADAVVLSNRTLDDGSVEIVALADAELAAVAPPAAAARPRAAAPRTPDSVPAAAVPGIVARPAAAPARMAANPYASGEGGLPDVFSSVFGASADLTETAAEADEDGSGAVASGAAAPSSAAPAPAAPAEPAPWLVEHAKRLTRQRDALLARTQPAPAAARAPQEAPPADWARDVVRDAERRIPAAAPRAPEPPASPAAKPSERPRLSAEAAAAVADAVKSGVEQIVNDTVMNELGALRGMMEAQFDNLMWHDRQRRSPVHGALTRHLFAAGFSAQLVRMLVDNLPAGDGAQRFDAAVEWAQSVLAANLPVLGSEDALMERGGVFALMGPTGVGKTTTTAKLAARCVMRFGASKVALLTTDSYRIGGHEQLRIFGKILGVPVHAVKDAGDLALALSELRNKHIVLIDTIGMSQRDRAVSDQIAMLHGANAPVQRLLLLNATSHGDTLNEVVQAYRSAGQHPHAAAPDLAGCILTKLDEATHLGGALDTVIRYKLPVHYVSTGQKVPENLYVATTKFLLKSAFCVPRDGSPFVPQDEDMPTLLSALTARATADLHEVRFG
ncbi:flagellar biosynthesis protein FlhF [Burkholderia pseudomultivorans]|uniref:Flagellar biosynthesis protein FlhF n=2 Tax=Burkholderia pseudomultivorans TaxID=1207504 RepID=A0ABU2EBN7_9BURK|nr:flagellar biosynthesis protein FlhF [Burkholderia pseudomultivorans]MDR8732149.1 Flagellar biosynthesis protein FlhF [Burkholderia pseudomultivorans]MDR8736507.1 Flagellar biosynthesis protein FlhF [Burkholderia pseudomultivorans]MDR8745305.1 Flagellar biosynthesis protein FlhF [Burkholderia pseudomultivorans]MDR8757300.1 Flagellar biosynthesis protein FlhF [Burkholderia pseudomultivorans]MDR8779339.1 Flagellar biosynthesis protein FlhF [Burkholderia pseudomultivorans]